MRRRPAFLLLLLIFASLLAGCGDNNSADPSQVVDSWSQAINGSDNEKAAALFAPDALVIQDGRRTTLEDQAAAETDLMGLYEGVPLTERDSAYVMAMPDRITIYRLPTLRVSDGDDDEVRRQVQITVVHEIAHHFGIEEGRLHELGFA